MRMSSIAFSKTYCENYNDLRLQLFMLKYICLINDVQSTQRMLCNKQSTVNLYHQPVTNSTKCIECRNVCSYFIHVWYVVNDEKIVLEFTHVPCSNTIHVTSALLHVGGS